MTRELYQIKKDIERVKNEIVTQERSIIEQKQEFKIAEDKMYSSRKINKELMNDYEELIKDANEEQV